MTSTTSSLVGLNALVPIFWIVFIVMLGAGIINWWILMKSKGLKSVRKK